MENQKNKDAIIRESIRKNRRTLSSNSFDDKVMAKIYDDLELKKQVSNTLKLSLIFFVVGTILGIGGTICFMLFSDAILGFSTRDFGLLALFVICVVSTMVFNNLGRLIKTYSG